MIGPTTLFATISQSMVFAVQVLRMMMLPGAATLMPRSVLVHWLPSMRLSVPRAWMPALRPTSPFSSQVLSRTTHFSTNRMPSWLLLLTVHPVIVQLL